MKEVFLIKRERRREKQNRP